MTIDPFVAPSLDDVPRQKQNVAPGSKLPAPPRWRPGRPGDLSGAQPLGAMLGSPGPDIGYALTMAERFRGRLHLHGLERADDALAVAGAIAMKRAAIFGRAPVALDVEIALGLLGYLDEVNEEFAELRAFLVHEVSHDYATRRALVDAVPVAILEHPPAESLKHGAVVQAALRRVGGEEVDESELEVAPAAARSPQLPSLPPLPAGATGAGPPKGTRSWRAKSPKR